MEQSELGDLHPGGGCSRNDEIVSIGAPARLDTLPEDCITMVIYRTSPRDACVVASVSKTVKSAAESDLVWEKFLPQDYSSLVPRSVDFSCKKEIYMSLANDSVLIDDGKKSIWLEKGSGNKCYMLSAMDLNIIWIDRPLYWKWNTDPESKFEKVAELRHVCCFRIRGKISCGMLSKGTHYLVYLVFKRTSGGSVGFEETPMEAQVGFVGKESSKSFVLLEPSRRGVRGEREADGHVEEPKERGDGWSEVKLGNFYISDGGCDDDGDEIDVVETESPYWKRGLIIQGFEFRPVKTQ
ncbi:BnaA06g34200D [Brassica napus]|uniref:BnaA06g34200D protein n=1 Tax=Brassica napus TaxID=3708 RepID=A0A078FX66_BRANA|nr:BnaA06g34200D [Brassica napus]